MRVALYARVSTEEQAREGTSLELQMDKLTDWANRESHIIAGKYTDDGYSGTSDDRPKFQLLMVDAKAKKFDVVVTTKLDRFFRNLRLLLQYEQQLVELGIKYVAIGNSIDTSTPFGRLVFQILGVVAEWEREMIAERMRDGRLKTWRKGKAASGKVLYGYTWDKENEKWGLKEEEAGVVGRVYSMYVDERVGMARIAEKLNQDGIPTGGWGTMGWTDRRIMWILHHPAYSGKQYMNRKQPINGKSIWDFQSGDISFDMPAIVDKQTWQLAQRRREMQKRVGRKDINSDSWLLQGLIKCGDCGYGYRCMKYASGHRVYKCWGRAKIKHLNGSPRCTSKSIGADWLETIVWQRVKACLEDSKVLRQSILNSLEKAEGRKRELALLCKPVDEKLDRVRGQMHRKDVIYEMGRLTEPEYRQQVLVLKKQEAELLQRRNDIDPEKMAELEILEGYVDWAKQFWAKADITLGDDGLVMGYDTKDIGKEGLLSGFNVGNIDLATGLSPSLSFGEVRRMSRRAALERFSITVWIKGDRAEIHGFIPTQYVSLAYNSVDEFLLS